MDGFTAFRSVLTFRVLMPNASAIASLVMPRFFMCNITRCQQYGFQCRFLYESVIITTPISSWQFGYHESRKTLRHESTVKINFETGDYAKTHEQFRERKMTCLEVIDYIAEHDKWRQEQQKAMP